MDLSQDFKEFVQSLNANKVEYLVVGGYAVTIHGFPRATGDIDFWVKPYPENAQRVLKSLSDFGFGSVDVKLEDLTKENKVIQFGFPPIRIDIMTSVSGLNFSDCWNEKKIIDYEGQTINFISLHHLRLNKKATGRAKDINDLKNLPEV